VLADVDLGALPELLSHLRKYRLRAAVDVADVSDEHRVWAHFGPSAVPPATIHADDSTEASTAAAAAGLLPCLHWHDSGQWGTCVG